MSGKHGDLGCEPLLERLRDGFPLRPEQSRACRSTSSVRPHPLRERAGCGQPVRRRRPDQFRLVVADQFAKRAIVCDRVRDTALRIIDAYSDLAMLSKLGLNARDLRKRQQTLTALRGRLNAPAALARPCPAVKQPQPFLMDVAAFAFPTAGGQGINSYCRSKAEIPGGWTKDGWGALVIVERGRAFDFLTWYRPLTIYSAKTHRPTLEDLRAEPFVVSAASGPVCCFISSASNSQKSVPCRSTLPSSARAFPAMPSGRPGRC